MPSERSSPTMRWWGKAAASSGSSWPDHGGAAGQGRAAARRSWAPALQQQQRRRWRWPCWHSAKPHDGFNQASAGRCAETSRASIAHPGRRPAPQWRRPGAGRHQRAQRRQACLASKERSDGQSWNGIPRLRSSSCGPATAAAQRRTAQPWGPERRRAAMQAAVGSATPLRPGDAATTDARTSGGGRSAAAGQRGPGASVGERGTPQPVQASGRRKTHDRSHKQPQFPVEEARRPCSGSGRPPARWRLVGSALANNITIHLATAGSALAKILQQVSAVDMRNVRGAIGGRRAAGRESRGWS